MEEQRKSKLIRQVKILLALKFKKDDPIPSELIPGLFIGSIGAALNKEFLISEHFTHVLTVADDLPNAYPELFTYKSINLLDTIEFNLLVHLPEAIEFIDSALTNNGKILVHCFAGKSRSASVCCAYLMHSLNLHLEESIAFLKEKRPCIMPNPGFLFQLQLYEKSLFPDSLELLN
jgi:protein-tyrosine phosphatase